MPDVVLVHGAFSGGFVWQPVADLLRANGHRVWTPTLTGLGERRHLLTHEVDLGTHIRDIEAVLYFEDIPDAVVVAHSYGGMVVAGLGDRAVERLAQVILIDAALPEDGEAIRDVYGSADDESLPPEIRALHRQSARDEDQLAIPVGPAHRADPRMSPHPLSTHWARVRRGRAFDPGIRRVYIRCTGWENINGVSFDRARAQGWTVWEIPTPHSAMVTHPALVAERIEDAMAVPA
jgi:pimeloyl-ACP methyl ester carboxylesterase